MNKFEVIGRLTGEPETRYTTEGKGITTFTMAVNNREEVTYIKITTFGSTAELIQKYTHKGDMILIDGNIKNNNYTDKEGKKHYGYQFIGTRVEFLSRSGKKEESKEESKKDPLPDEAFIEFGNKIDIADSDIAF